MPSALESYYQKLAKNKEMTDPEKEAAALEFMGTDVVKKKNPGMFIKLLDLLDRPGNAARALLVGKLGGLKGLIPFAKTIEELTGIDVALNDDELVKGTEVIEKWFGKQKQVKGKIDTVDVLGLMVEIIADPLWLVGGPGISKAGKAAKLIKGVSDDALKTAFKLAKAGKPITSKAQRGLVKAIKAIAVDGKIPAEALKSVGWAEEAAKGHRALLSVGLPGHRKTIIEGANVWGALDKASTKIRMGAIGKKFLPATKRVPTEFQEGVHAIAIKNKDLANYNIKQAHLDLSALFKRAEKAGVKGEDLTKFIEANYAGKPITKALNDIVIKRGKIAGGRIKTTQATLDEVLEATGGEITPQVRKLQGKIERLKAFPNKANKKSVKLVERGKELQSQADDILASQGNPTEFSALAKEYKTIGDDILQAEKNLGVPVGELTAPIAHQRRVVTDDFAKWLDKNPHYGSRGEFSVKAGTQKGRSAEIAGMTRDEVNAHFAEKGFKGDVFKGEVAEATMVRASESARVRGAASTIHETIEKFATKEITEGGIRVSDLIEKTGLKIPKEKYKDLFINHDIANALTEVSQIAKKDEFAGMVSKMNKFYKGAFTLYWPGYHGRNAISNVFLNWIGGVKNPKSYIQAMKLQKAAHKTRKLVTKGLSWDDAVARVAWPTIDTVDGAVSGHVFYDMLDRHGIVGQSLGQMGVPEVGGMHIQKAKTFIGRAVNHETKVSEIAKTVGMGIENNARIAHAVEKVGLGMGIQDAATSAKRVLFDYGDLSQFEKEVMRDKAFLFYTFARKNLPLQVKTLIHQPAKQAVFSHLAGGSPQMNREAIYYRDYEQEKMMIPTAFKDQSGNPYMVRGTGLPIEEAFGPMSGPGVGIMDSLSRVASRTLSRTTPIPKAGMELAFKKNLYFDRDIDSWSEWAANQLPSSRASGTYRTLANPNEGLGSKIAGYATGVRFRPYNPTQAREIARRDVLNKYLAQQEGVRKFSRYFSPNKEDEQLQTALKEQYK